MIPLAAVPCGCSRTSGGSCDAVAPCVARDPAVIDADADRRQAEADRGDAGRRARLAAVADQPVRGVRLVPEEVERACTEACRAARLGRLAARCAGRERAPAARRDAQRRCDSAMRMVSSVGIGLSCRHRLRSVTPEREPVGAAQSPVVGPRVIEAISDGRRSVPRTPRPRSVPPPNPRGRGSGSRPAATNDVAVA